jgi:hypothetical protein
MSDNAKSIAVKVYKGLCGETILSQSLVHHINYQINDLT